MCLEVPLASATGLSLRPRRLGVGPSGRRRREDPAAGGPRSGGAERRPRFRSPAGGVSGTGGSGRGVNKSRRRREASWRRGG